MGDGVRLFVNFFQPSFKLASERREGCPNGLRRKEEIQECLSKLILFGEKSLRHALREYVVYYHHERNHQGKENLLLFPASDQLPQSERKVHSRERLGGLLRCLTGTGGERVPQHELLACAQCGCFAFSCFEDFAIRVNSASTCC